MTPANLGNPFDQLSRFVGGGIVPARPDREQRLRNVAERQGLRFQHEDARGLDQKVRFPSTLSSGTHGVENVMAGTWKDLQVTVFDRWSYQDEYDEQKHRTKRTWSRYSCLLTRLGLRATETFHLERENVFSRFADHIGLRDIDLESEDFNRAFTVRCKDRKFATDLVDQATMTWLLEIKDTIPGDVAFQIDLRQLLLYGPERKPAELVPLLRLLKAFVDHVPAVAFSLYGVQKPENEPPAPEA